MAAAQQAVQDAVEIVSGGNIALKTIGGTTIAGSGDIALKTIGGANIIGSGDIPLPVIPSFKTVGNQTITGSGNIEITAEVEVDAELSTTSPNAVQNKAVSNKFENIETRMAPIEEALAVERELVDVLKESSNIYNPTNFQLKTSFDNNTVQASSTTMYKTGGDNITAFSGDGYKRVGLKYFPVEVGQTYIFKLNNKPQVNGTDGKTYSYDAFNTIWFFRRTFVVTGVNVRVWELEHCIAKNGNYYSDPLPDGYTGDRPAGDWNYKDTDYTDRVLIENYNDLSQTNAPASEGKNILATHTDCIRVTILSDKIKYISIDCLPKELPVYGITSIIDNPTKALMTEIENGLQINKGNALQEYEEWYEPYYTQEEIVSDSLITQMQEDILDNSNEIDILNGKVENLKHL